MKKSEILARLAQVAPAIHLQTLWTRDDDAKWDVQDPSLDPDDFQAWQSEVRASAICAGAMLNGSDYLGGTWEKFGAGPEKNNPEISGYFPQMCKEALAELCLKLPSGSDLRSQCKTALEMF